MIRKREWVVAFWGGWWVFFAVRVVVGAARTLIGAARMLFAGVWRVFGVEGRILPAVICLHGIGWANAEFDP